MAAPLAFALVFLLKCALLTSCVHTATLHPGLVAALLLLAVTEHLWFYRHARGLARRDQ